MLVALLGLHRYVTALALQSRHNTTPTTPPLLASPAGQTIFLFAPCLSLYGALRGTKPFGNALDVVGVCVAVGAILLETVSDQQMVG